MKFNFRKISAIASSALLGLGLVALPVAAANYPAPFSTGGANGYAVVYGTGQGVASTDYDQAQSVAEQLQSIVGGDGTTITGGKDFKLDKPSNHFNLGDALNTIYPNLDSDEMNALADGTYDDGDIDTEFTQKITLSSTTLGLFADSDYQDKAPTLGFMWSNGDTILNYTMNFDDEVNVTLMDGTDMPLLGKEYYVLDATWTGTSGQIDLLDTSGKQEWDVGESGTVGGHEVTLTYVDSTSAKFIVDGESITVNEGSFKKIPGTDSYLVVTDISYQGYQTGTQRAEFSVGSGKIELIHGQEAKLNGDRIRGLETTLTGTSGFIDTITLTWKSYQETFLTQTNAISMPQFEAIHLTFGGMNFPSPEIISVENGETLIINMGNFNLPLMWYQDGVAPASQLFGEDGHVLKLTAANLTQSDLGYANGTAPWWGGSADNTTNMGSPAKLDMNVSEDERFLVTNIDPDLTDTHNAYYEVSLIDVTGGLSDFSVELIDLIGSRDLTFDEINEEHDAGDIAIKLVGFSADNSSAIFEFTSGTGGTSAYNKAISEKGLVVSFPTTIDDATNGTGYVITFTEADKDGDVNEGVQFTATVKNTSNEKFHVSTHNVTTYEVSKDNEIGYVVSDLASKVMFDDSADENDFSIEYYGQEVYGDVRVFVGGEITSDGDSLGGVLVTDNEVSSVQDRNLVVVGGSCINSVAAKLLGSDEPLCGSAWTSATGVDVDQFTIWSLENPYNSSKIALLVAGYEADDTVAAASRIMNQPSTIDTTVGSKYIGVTGTGGTSTISKVA